MSSIFRFGFSSRVMVGSLLFIALLLAALANPAWAQQTFTVNSTADSDGDCDAAECTLREAIGAANDTANAQDTPDTIEFAIPVSEAVDGVFTISPATNLPTITEAVIIDGYTQEGATRATADEAASLKVELDGSGAGDASGLTIDPGGGGSTVRGLAINRFSGFGGIHLLSDGNTIEGNHIGTNVAGTDTAATEEHSNASAGVLIDGGIENPAGSSDNTIGGTEVGERNVISGNGSQGVWIFGTFNQAQSASGNEVLGNYIGTDASGKKRLANGDPGGGFGGGGSGVEINLASGNTIGGTEEGARNILSGNGAYGVLIHRVSSNNKVQGNYIGADVSGTDSVTNERDGVRIEGGSSGNLVGGTDEGAGNVISGNNSTTSRSGPVNTGVTINGANTTGNIVQGNFIGTDKDGTAPLGNSELNDERGDFFTGNGQFGVRILNSPDNTIGGTEPGAKNVISGNRGFTDQNGVTGTGLAIDGPAATGNEIQGNYIGTDETGMEDLGNLDGVKIIDAPANLIGGTDEGARNVISGNIFEGVRVLGESAGGNEIKGNYVGTDASGTGAIPNATGLGGSPAGVDIAAPRTIVGGAEPGAGNVISGNGRVFNDGQLSGFGVAVGGRGVSNPEALGGSVIQGNYIGTDKTGTVDLGNIDCAVIISDVPDNVVGGTAEGEGNVISGNGKNGVQIDSANASGNEVLGNLIGTDVDGGIGIGNDGVGVLISEAPGNTVGGAGEGAGNVISDSGADPGVAVLGEAASGNEVLGNLIGTDETGMEDLGNKESGVLIEDAPGNTIGGANDGEGNVVSANGGDGIQILGETASGNVVHGNLSGTDATGEAVLPNFNAGVAVIDAPDNVIGGTEEGMRNVISANVEDGVYIGGEAASGNEVLGNLIGTDESGASDLGNERDGIRVTEGAGENTFGGESAGAQNVVAFNGATGVLLRGIAGNENSILQNSIFSNDGLGIDLGEDGATPNDENDADTGPNNLQNYPLITEASTSGDSTTVAGSLDGAPNATFALRFFASSEADPSGFGEGEGYMGVRAITTDSGGAADFAFTLPGEIPPGESVAATATDPDGSTSEFSNAESVAEAGGGGQTGEETVTLGEGVLGTDQTVSTGSAVSEENPVSTGVMIPAGTTVTQENRTVSITETPEAEQSEPRGFSFLDYQIDIEAPDATAENPLELTFLLDGSLLPEGMNAQNIEVFRNGARVLSCDDDSGEADPNPCVSVRDDLGDDIRMVVLTSSASAWNFGERDESGGGGGGGNPPDNPKPPKNPNACTIKGTSEGDVLRGTPKRDVICGRGGDDTLRGLGGDDRIVGGAGDDTLRGGSGKDALVGGKGRDRLFGGAGRDSLDARDGVRSNDVANGGSGRDSCDADRRDTRRSCP